MSEISATVLHKSKSLSLEGRRGLKQVLEQRARLFALNIKEFTLLDEKDQVSHEWKTDDAYMMAF